MEWIKCSDSLPDCQRVIGYNPGNGDVGEYYWDCDEGVFSYYNFCGQHGFGTNEVTHWMPIPPPPAK